MDPVAVLANLGSLGGELPRTLVVGCQPLDVEEGMGLTPPVTAAVDVAITTINGLLDDLLNESVGAGSQES
jgi:hydrogenase maturation protease